MFGLKTPGIGRWSYDVERQVYLGISGNIVWIELTCEATSFNALEVVPVKRMYTISSVTCFGWNPNTAPGAFGCSLP